MKPLVINEINDVYKSKFYNTYTVNFFYVRTEKTPSYYLSLFKYRSQPVLRLITVSNANTHIPYPPQVC